MSEMYLGVVERAEMTETVISAPPFKRRDVKLYIPKNIKVIDYPRRQSPYFWLERAGKLVKNRDTVTVDIASPENPVLTHSAGAISVFLDISSNFRYVCFSKKDKKAERDPEFLVPRNGFPQCEDEWYTNDHLYREAFEEIVMFTKQGKLIVPYGDKHIRTVEEAAGRILRRGVLTHRGVERVKIDFVDGLDTLTVCREGDREPILEDRGIITWTPESGLDLIKIMRVHMPIYDIALFDAEISPDGELLQRPVYVFDLDDIKSKAFGDSVKAIVHSRKKDGSVGISKEKSLFHVDKVARSALRHLTLKDMPVYPVDPIVESFAFLSNPKVLREFDGFGWSALERRLKESTF